MKVKLKQMTLAVSFTAGGSCGSDRACADMHLLCLQPLKVVDPDHPLAALVRKAQADSSAPAPHTTDGAAGQPSQVEYTTDCEYWLCILTCVRHIQEHLLLWGCAPSLS